MMFTALTRSAGLISCTAALACIGSALAQTPTDLDENAVKSAFAVEQFEYENLELPAGVVDGFVVPFTFKDVEYSITMSAHSVRSPKFQVLVPDASGKLVKYDDIPAPMTYTGTINEIPGSRVAGSLIDQQFHAVLYVNEDVMWEIAPLREAVPDAEVTEYVIFDTADALPLDFTCGVTDEDIRHVHAADPNGGGGGYEDALKYCEIAFDADYEFYNRNGQSVPATIQDIENVLNNVDTIYTRDVQVGYDLTTIIVRTSEPDPYTSFDPNGLLNQFQAQWNSQHSDIERDVAHLMTGKNLSGNVIGIAFLRVICNLSNAYGLSQSRYSSNMSYRAALTSHELGHNWSASHCDGNGDCRIMCSGIGGCNGDTTRFGNLAKSEITSFKNSRSCLSDAPQFRLDISPPPPLQGGQRHDWKLRNGEPFARAALFYSLVGQGQTQVAPGIFIELRSPKLIPPVRTMDANGEAFWAILLPNVKIRLFTQAVDENGNLTNNRIDDIVRN